MFLLRAVLNILVRNASPRGPMCFRCLIFNLSGPCELLTFTLFHSLLDLRSSECNVVSLYVVCCSVNVSVCFVCCALDSVCELFGETICNVFGCSFYFVVECYGCVKVCVVELCWIDHVWSSKECVCCACDPSCSNTLH